MRKIATFIVLLLMSTLLMQFVWHVSEPGKKADDLSPEKINLALRRTAHQLLQEAGDSTSRIPPVEQISANTWLIRLEQTFDYDQLPATLQASFKVHDIGGNYDVAVVRCVDGLLQLGYNYPDVANTNDVACGGRDLPPDCYNLQVTFSAGAAQQNGLPLTGWFFSTVLAITLFSLGRRWQRAPEKVQDEYQGETNSLHFGHSRLDVTNQLLVCENIRHQLTYREAKLLNLFVRHPNQVLERNFIMENVWADEGILVGRSVDMFVSRLRKMLRDDPSVQLVAVHGVGYRMEVGQA